jgi:hypothetical protein
MKRMYVEIEVLSAPLCPQTLAGWVKLQEP